MSLIGHLAELRRRIFISLVAVIIGIIVSFVFRDFIFDLLMRPGDDPELYFHTLTGAIGPTMKVALLGGVILALPVVAYQAVQFLAPGLTRSERRYFLIMLPGVALCFLAGMAFAYFILIPPIIDFLFTFGEDVATPLVGLDSYVNTVTSLLFWMGIAFETPFIMYFFARLGIMSPDFYARQRRTWFVISFVLGAIITPTFDPVNQSLVAAPFIVLYELGIWVSRLALRGRRKRQAREAANREG
ncbi:MAG: twin-arginine translocase subunit TatC [Chloroflexi bacterium]|nr:twin-arginine translocase subunit TatC [Chloroflexota bacterium]